MVDSPTCLSTPDSVLLSMILFRLDQILEGLKWSTATRQGVLDSGMRKRRTESMATVGLQVMSAADTPMKTGESSMTYAQRRPSSDGFQTVFSPSSDGFQTVTSPSSNGGAGGRRGEIVALSRRTRLRPKQSLRQPAMGLRRKLKAPAIDSSSDCAATCSVQHTQ